MGWKTFKEHFGITHIVQIRGDRLLIGSPYISQLAAIDLGTGAIRPESYHSDFLRHYYPDISAATQIEIKDLLDAEDTFVKSIPVYTCEGLKILTKYCEEIGYPNVTHDGLLMHDNTFSANMNDVVEMAKRDRGLQFESLRERIRDLSHRLDDTWREVHLLEKEVIVYE